MKRKESFPAPGEAEKENLSIDEKKVELFAANEELLADEIFQKIQESIDDQWDELNDANKDKVLDAFEELAKSIRVYADSYREVKGIASFKLSDEASPEATKRYQGLVSEKDERERRLHNAFLDSVNILSRRMKGLGLDNSWRGDPFIYPQPGDTENDRQINRTKVKRWMFRIFHEN